MPGAWEILKARRERVLCCVIMPPELRHSRAWTRMWKNLQLGQGGEVIDVQGLPYDAARNHAVKAAVDGDWGYLFFLDSDTIPPANIVPQLIATGRDFIGGLYHQRGGAFLPVACNMVRDAKGDWVRGGLPPHQPGEVIPVDFLGMGATLISRRCMQAVLEHFPRPFAWGKDIAPVPDDHGGQLPPLSEDYMFCLRAKALGYQPWVHTGIVAQHEMMVVVTDKGVQFP